MKDDKTREVLTDLRLPHSRLYAAVGNERTLHIYDETNKLWIGGVKFKTKKSE